MKVLHISRTMGQGGAEKVVYQICKDIKDIKMVVASTGGVYEEKLIENNIKHCYIPDIDSKNPMAIIKTFFLLNKIIRNEKVDIIHSHHRMAAFYSRILSICNRKIKRIYTAHNVFYNKKVLLKFSLKGSKIIAVGNGVKNNLIEYYGIKNENINVIYNSIDKPKQVYSLQDNFLKENNNIYIGNIGRLSEQKGIDIFIKAMSEIIKNYKNVFAIIIGDGELRQNLENLAKNLEIQNNIKFLGYRSDVIELIKQMNFIVLSSRWEGFPLTPIETFSEGKTIIASDIDGNNEIVIDGYNGLLFKKDNVNDLKDKIERLINDKELKIQLEKNAKKAYCKKFSYEAFINSYKSLYINI